ncbi:MAG: AzlD domain-containing protein [Oscillibacter sp.]|nr:AzlD domain-containing protein [Oscillibacter sp.]MBQ8851016.1 AzlD domain-containing protein [Oscillibacter sp.]
MSIYVYIAVMALTTYLIRMLPMTLFQKEIKSRFLKSFLAYVPCTCLTAMTFPAILYATENLLSGGIALAVAVILALKGRSLVVVAAGSCIAVFLAERIVPYLPF